ncbi:hypothetical protein CG747_39645 [Streptomyces sp. CB02959]|nr:hypothetical protein CG747_39645 [Streptomyces sp. CB02959]
MRHQRSYGCPTRARRHGRLAAVRASRPAVADGADREWSLAGEYRCALHAQFGERLDFSFGSPAAAALDDGVGVVVGLEDAGDDLGGVDVRLGGEFFEFEVVDEGVGDRVAVLT